MGENKTLFVYGKRMNLYGSFDRDTKQIHISSVKIEGINMAPDFIDHINKDLGSETSVRAIVFQQLGWK